MANVPYSPAEVAQVRRLAGEGLTDTQIGRRTGIPPRRVKGIRHKNKIETPWHISTRRRGSAPLTDIEVAALRRQVNWRPGFDYAKDDMRHNAREAVTFA